MCIRDRLYTGNPNEDEYARIIPEVTEITDELYKIAGGKEMCIRDRC